MSEAPATEALLASGERLAALEESDLMAGVGDEAFGRLTRLATRSLDVPIAFVSLLDAERQVFRSCVGFPDPWEAGDETPAAESFCQHTMMQEEHLLIEDARQHPLVADSPAIDELGIVAYAGVPLTTPGGQVLGSFCVAKSEPHDWTETEIATLEDLAETANTEIELRDDIRRRERLERAIRERERRFEALIATVNDVITVIDPDGIIRYESPSIRHVLGYEPEELVGAPALEYVHPEDRDDVGTELAKAMESTEEVRTAVFRFRHSDGGWRWLESSGRAVPAGSGLVGVVATSRDVTERRAVQEERRMLVTAVEQAKSGILVTGPSLDPPGPEIVYANPAMTGLTGYDRDELLGSTPRILQGEETDRDILDQLKEALLSGESFSAETVNYRRDRTPYVVEWRITPVHDEEGKIIHFVSVQQDVTERRRYRERLENAVRKRTHDLRRSQNEVLDRLARAAEFRDDETGEHTQRVGVTVALLAAALGLDDRRVTLLRKTAPLHDLGKIGIPDFILLKPGRLTEREFAHMKTHTTIGAALLSGGRSELVQMAEIIARSHHERWDGSGYPQGLEGEQIPLPGRLLAVADVFDALTHSRPYKPAWSVDAARAEIEQQAGKQFDPEIVEVFLGIADRLMDELEKVTADMVSVVEEYSRSPT